MSIESMSWVLNYSPVSGSEKIVLLGIANHADDQGGNAWPSVSTLARYANVSERAVQQALQKLRDGGHIDIIPNAGGTAKTRSDRRPNLYKILYMQADGTHRTSPRSDTNGVKSSAQRGEVGFVNGAKQASPEPSLEPPIEPSVAAAQPTLIVAGEPVNVVSNRLAKGYTDVVPLSRFPAIAGIAKKALQSGYDEQTIADALGRLATEGRPVTTETLRIEMEGLPPASRMYGQRTATAEDRLAGLRAILGGDA